MKEEINKILGKSNYTADDLVLIMKILRNGCPWDKKQDHKTIRKNLIEETYEVVEAIDYENTDLLKEELGDLLLQIVFHTQIEDEKNAFNFDDVADGICKKLILRHPHIFSDVKADTSEKVLENWDNIKKVEKNQTSQTEVLNSVSRSLPALMRAQKLSHKAAKCGFDWTCVYGPIQKLYEEIDELKKALESGNKINQKEEFGDILFACTNIARFIDADSEEALYESTEKFLRRFSIMEQISNDESKKLEDMTAEELDKLWNKAKDIISRNAD